MLYYEKYQEFPLHSCAYRQNANYCCPSEAPDNQEKTELVQRILGFFLNPQPKTLNKSFWILLGREDTTGKL